MRAAAVVRACILTSVMDTDVVIPEINVGPIDIKEPGQHSSPYQGSTTPPAKTSAKGTLRGTRYASRILYYRYLTISTFPCVILCALPATSCYGKLRR